MKLTYTFHDFTAYLDLSYLYQQEGNLSRMKKMKETALDILRQLPGQTLIKEIGNITVNTLLQQLEYELKEYELK